MTEKLILFGGQPEYALLDRLCAQNSADTAKALGDMLCIAEKYHIYGDVYKGFIAWLILNDENPYSLACEMGRAENGGLRRFALSDSAVLFDAWKADFADKFGNNFCSFSYTNDDCLSTCRNAGNMCVKLANELDKAENPEQFLDIITAHYNKFGVGKFGLYNAFYVEDNNSLVPVDEIEQYRYSDIWGYERQKQQIIANTEAFLDKRAANNVLLYGDSGTGKSTCVKATLNEYSARGLRMIELYKHQFSCLPQLIRTLRRRRYRFIIFMDDLSFEDFETEYKFLKAVIEGGLASKPENVLIYATSNRRHLIRESFSDRSTGDDIHKNDTVQEKLSLSDRFGLTVSFTKPMQKDYFEIVKYLANKQGIEYDEQLLCKEAAAWGLKHGGLSGRVARQYINHLQSGK